MAYLTDRSPTVSQQQKLLLERHTHRHREPLHENHWGGPRSSACLAVIEQDHLQCNLLLPRLQFRREHAPDLTRSLGDRDLERVCLLRDSCGMAPQCVTWCLIFSTLPLDGLRSRAVQELLLQRAGFTLPIVEGIDGRLVVMPEHVFEGVMGNGGGKR